MLPLINVFGWRWYTESFKAASGYSLIHCLAFQALFLVYFITPMRDLMYTLEQKGVSHETSYIMLAAMQNIVDLEGGHHDPDSQKSAVLNRRQYHCPRQAFFRLLGRCCLAPSQAAKKN